MLYFVKKSIVIPRTALRVRASRNLIFALALIKPTLTKSSLQTVRFGQGIFELTKLITPPPHLSKPQNTTVFLSVSVQKKTSASKGPF